MKKKLIMLRNVLRVMEREVDRVIESGDDGFASECNVDLILESASRLCPHYISKYEALNDVLHISRATFDRRVSDGVYPAGKPRKGAKELFWDEAELITAHQIFLKDTGASK